MVPVRPLLSNVRYCIFTNFIKLVGTVPVRLLKLKFRVVRLVRYPNDDGIVPLSPVKLYSRCTFPSMKPSLNCENELASELNEQIEIGIDALFMYAYPDSSSFVNRESSDKPTGRLTTIIKKEDRSQ